MKFLLYKKPQKQTDTANDKDDESTKHKYLGRYETFCLMRSIQFCNYKGAAGSQALKNGVRQIAGFAASGIHKRTPAGWELKGSGNKVQSLLKYFYEKQLTSLDPLMCLQMYPHIKLEFDSIRSFLYIVNCWFFFSSWFFFFFSWQLWQQI